MANNKSAEKRIRIAERNRIRNKGFKTKLKTSLKNFESLALEGNAEEAAKAFVIVQKTAGKAVSKGAIHKNKAARKVSQVAARLGSISSVQVQAVKADPITKEIVEKEVIEIEVIKKEAAPKTVKKVATKKTAVKKVTVKKTAVKKTTAKKDSSKA